MVIWTVDLKDPLLTITWVPSPCMRCFSFRHFTRQFLLIKTTWLVVYFDTSSQFPIAVITSHAQYPNHKNSFNIALKLIWLSLNGFFSFEHVKLTKLTQDLQVIASLNWCISCIQNYKWHTTQLCREKINKDIET